MDRAEDFKVLNSEARQRLRELREREKQEKYEADCSAQLSRAILSYQNDFTFDQVLPVVNVQRSIEEDREIHQRTLDALSEEIKSLRELERLWNQK